MITVERQNGNEKETWSFDMRPRDFTGDTVILSLYYYARRTRQTPRHKWQDIEFWSGINPRGSTIPLTSVPIPDDVRQEAREAVKVEVVA